LNDTFRFTFRHTGIVAALIATFALPGTAMVAQSGAPSGNTSEASLILPDEPGLMGVSSSADAMSRDAQSAAASAKTGAPASGATLPEASKFTMTIEPGQAAPSLTPENKVLLGLKDSVSPFSALGWLASAGWEQATNGSPNYGTDRGAFGQRLGAAALRDVSGDIFSNSVMAPLMREDPRYYRMGPGHNFVVRLVYAGTRTIITRTDGGKLSPNLSLLAGTLASAGLTNAYYPQVNRGGSQTMLTFGSSLGGTAVGNVVTEFYEDALHLFHLGHK
jgi:hypothetical protein